ncbi:MAG: protein phosphatase 2C domain-containing protein, partial [Clostridia bacterium]|nr:protein phosphatase 2C domain-containing protein [Clostridia bacterium]
MKILGKTDAGMRRRSNQDTFAVLEKNGYALAVVCDGVGGSNGGETASETAKTVFCNSVRSSLSGTNPAELDERSAEDILSQAVAEANAEVFRKAQEDAELEGMATTLVAALICGNSVYIVNIGDSRLYAIS